MNSFDRDRIPNKMPLQKVYSVIQNWLQANIELVKRYESEYMPLVEALRPADEMRDIEMRAILGEVMWGNLEWAKDASDGQYTLRAYVWAAEKSSSDLLHLSEDEKSELRQSHLWPHLMLSIGE